MNRSTVQRTETANNLGRHDLGIGAVDEVCLRLLAHLVRILGAALHVAILVGSIVRGRDDSTVLVDVNVVASRASPLELYSRTAIGN